MQRVINTSSYTGNLVRGNCSDSSSIQLLAGFVYLANSRKLNAHKNFILQYFLQMTNAVQLNFAHCLHK